MQFFVQASAKVIVDPPAPEVPASDGAPPAPPVAVEPPAAVVPPVAKAPPVPPVARAPPVPPVAGVPPAPELLLLQAPTPDAIPITNTSGPILFFNMTFLNYLPRSTLTDHGVPRKKAFVALSRKSRTLIESLQAAGVIPTAASEPTAGRGRALRSRPGRRPKRCFPRPSECKARCGASRPPPRPRRRPA
jgi:hypothetical protein